MQARLKKLSLRGFRSFVGQSDIEFPDAGMVLLRGKNIDTGGSSGSGKSSILLAISYLLGFCKFPATHLQSWLTAEPMQVNGVFAVEQGELVITRGQNLTLTLNGVKVVGSAKQLEERISSNIGLTPELLQPLTYRAQKQPGLFLSKTDAQKKEFLTSLLGLEKFERAFELSQESVRELDPKVKGQEYIVGQISEDLKRLSVIPPARISSEDKFKSDLKRVCDRNELVKSQISTLRSELVQFDNSIEGSVAVMRAQAQPLIEQIEAKISDARLKGPEFSELDQARLRELRENLTQAEFFVADELREDQSRYARQRQEADSVYARLLLLEKQLSSRIILEKKIDEIDSKRLTLDRYLCPTCERPWEKAESERARLSDMRATFAHDLQKLEGLKPQVAALQEQYKALGQFVPSPTLEELRAIVNDIKQQIVIEQARLDNELNLLKANFDKDLAELSSKLQEQKLALTRRVELHRANMREHMNDKRQELEDLEREAANLESQIRGFEAALNRVQIDNAREMEREAQARRHVDEVGERLRIEESKLARLHRELKKELDFQKLVGREGFLGAIFDEVLWEITEETNRLLSQFPNTAHVSIHFRSESVSQKGTIKKSIVPVVAVSGYETPLSSGLSGGMETAVELAVDLAVATVVSRRTGSSPGWMVLDESFTGLGPVESEASMEILRAFAKDKLVLVVDHASEVKGLFDQFIDVRYEQGRSVIEK